MKKSTLEKQLKKAIAKNESLQEWKQEKTKAKKICKKDLQEIKMKVERKEIEKAKEKLLKEKHLKEWKEIEKKSKLESFSWLYWNQNLFESFCFSWKDFYLHWIDLNDDEKKRKLFYIYNQIESIWKWMNLNEVEKIILENLKKRLIIEFCNNFENNLKKKNAKDIKSLKVFFENSHLKQYIKNAKENESLNIFECEKENIFWKSSNNFESKYIEKINNKYIIEKIWKLESLKAKELLKEKRNWKKLNWIEKASFLKNKNKLAKLSNTLKEKTKIQWWYNLKSKQIENSINQNKFLLKASKQIERMKRKVFEKSWIDLKEKELKKTIFESEKLLNEIENWNIELTWIENLKILESQENAKKELKKIIEKKKEIEKKIFWIYQNQIEKIINHWKQAKEFELNIYKKEIASLNINKIVDYLKNEYKDFFKNECKNII